MGDRGQFLSIIALIVSACGARTALDVPTVERDAGMERDAGTDAMSGCDAGMQDPSVVAGTPLGASCTGEGTAGFQISAPGCPAVAITPAFVDRTDESGGQPAAFEISSDTRCLTVTWDDCPSGCDCDLDISHEVCVEATRTCGALVVRVTNRVVDYEAANMVAAGYAITDYGDALLSSGADVRVFFYACDR